MNQQPPVGISAVLDHFERTLRPEVPPNYFMLGLRLARSERNRFVRAEVIAKEAARVSYGG